MVNAKNGGNDMQFRRLHLALAVLLLTALALSVQAQKPAEVWAEWETISPEGEEFTVSMPKNPTTESTTFPYHKMELKARLYLATSAAGPVLAIASLSGIKSDPAAYSDFARFNSYMDAFKDFFPAKVRAKEAPAKLTLVSNKPFRGHTGRAFKLTIGDLAGSVNAFATKKRFYAIVSLNTKKDEALEEKFLSSFQLPERQLEQPKTNAGVNPETGLNAEEPTVVRSDDGKNRPVNAEGNTENASEPGTGNAENNQQQNRPQKKGPIAGGMLNGKAIYMPVPEVASGEATGVVLVAVVIDEQGSVIEARAVSGPQHLHAAAVSAARLARFSPTLLMGEPVRVSGTLTYNFVKSN
jgi:Gram-negative bacterial TonB protein C-terminal